MRKATLAAASVIFILGGGAGLVGGSGIAAAPGGAMDPAPAGGVPSGAVRAFCFIETRLMDVTVNPGPLVARIEVFSADGLHPLDVSRIEPGVHLTSVGDTPLPAPGGNQEGIGEARDARTREDKADVRRRGSGANGVVELVVRFSRPSDGDPSTIEDGDGGDILAMLTDVPDGRSAAICLAGSLGEEQFACCDTVMIRNRGLRNLPPGLRPTDSATRP